METTDIGLAAYILLQGKDVQVDRVDRQHSIFIFEECQEVRDWQAGQVMVNALGFLSCYRTLIRKVKRNGTRNEYPTR